MVWLAGPQGDEALARELGLRLARAPGLAELELMYGSWDPPGARLLDVVAVMDRLVSPGGDPWKRRTDPPDPGPVSARGGVRGVRRDRRPRPRRRCARSSGDVLLQVVLHARMAEEAAAPWSIDDVAGDLVDKLVRRNPHVFAEVRGGRRGRDHRQLGADQARARRSVTPLLDGIVWRSRRWRWQRRSCPGQSGPECRSGR